VHAKKARDKMVQLHSLLNLARNTAECVASRFNRFFAVERASCTHWQRNWMGPRTGTDILIFRSSRKPNHAPSVVRLVFYSLYRLHYYILPSKYDMKTFILSLGLNVFISTETCVLKRNRQLHFNIKMVSVIDVRVFGFLLAVSWLFI
jgi:hypothetical protein